MKITETDMILEILPELFLKPPSAQEAIEIFHLLGFDSLSNINDVDLEIKKRFTAFSELPGGEHKLPPYESYWHRNKKKTRECFLIVISRTTDEIKENYDYLEIQTISNLHEPPDHIAFELSVYLSLLNVVVKQHTS
ncbi:MAG: molecular chaperone TorD family protein [Flavobacteriaceae bacterium]|nr:molecular chaperone TorD family protein [Flavobacteriaceae bacterium]